MIIGTVGQTIWCLEMQRIESRVMRFLVVDENLRADGRCGQSR